MSTISEIRKEIQVAFGAQEVLDDLVHEIASREASRINNEGLKEQLEYLNRNGMSDEDVLKHIQEANQ